MIINICIWAIVTVQAYYLYGIILELVERSRFSYLRKQLIKFDEAKRLPTFTDPDVEEAFIALKAELEADINPSVDEATTVTRYRVDKPVEPVDDDLTRLYKEYENFDREVDAFYKALREPVAPKAKVRVNSYSNLPIWVVQKDASGRLCKRNLRKKSNDCKLHELIHDPSSEQLTAEYIESAPLIGKRY